MRSLPFLLLLLCVSTASASTFPITSFEPDTAMARRRAQAEPPPVWVGIQVAPVVGDSWVPGEPRIWDPGGTPWLAMSVAWPSTEPHEMWLALGYERWRYTLQPELPFSPSVLLPPLVLKLDQATVRVGYDQWIARGHVVSGALGGGFGLGLGYAGIEQYPGTEWSILGEFLVHGLVYARLDERTRLGAGATVGPTYDFRHGGDALWHWELELHLERAVGGRRPAP